MDSARIPQGADPNPNTACVDAKRLRCSSIPANHISKVLDDNNTSSWPAPVPPLDDENLLGEILLRLPPNPSSLPRASLVCTHWRSILSDPHFLKRFRKHHCKPPLLGLFAWKALRGIPIFTSIMEPPDRIPSTRFVVPESHKPDESWKFTGCRHGLAVLVNLPRGKIAVWDPLTGQHHHLTFPPGLDRKRMGYYYQATVLCYDAEDGHVHGDCFLSPFKLVFICDIYKKVIVSLYDSVSGVWTNIISMVTNTILVIRPSILVRNALFWSTYGGDILVYDIEKQTLGMIEKPAHNHVTNYWSCFQLLRMEDGVLGLVVLSELTVQLWVRKSNFDGVVGWVLWQKIIQLQELFPRMMPSYHKTVLIVGYDEVTNVIVLSTMIGNFMLQLDSIQIKHIIKRDYICNDTFFPYTNFYTTGRGVGWKVLDQKL